MNADAITQLLEGLLEADFSFRKVGPTAAQLAELRTPIRSSCSIG